MWEEKRSDIAAITMLRTVIPTGIDGSFSNTHYRNMSRRKRRSRISKISRHSPSESCDETGFHKKESKKVKYKPGQYFVKGTKEKLKT